MSAALAMLTVAETPVLPDHRILLVETADMDPTFRRGEMVLCDLAQDSIRYDAIYLIKIDGRVMLAECSAG